LGAQIKDYDKNKACSTKKIRNSYKVLVSKPLKGREHLQDAGVDGRVIELILNKQGVRTWI
jgi:hypothetical protein